MGKSHGGSTVVLAMVNPERLRSRPEFVVESRGGTNPERLRPRPELTPKAVLQRLRTDLERASQCVGVGVSS
jgi:hypothetical protein